jgi:hypothetical protein
MEAPMSDPVDALVVDLLEWIGPGNRPYAEVIDAWRTSCPRLPVWEEANARGYIVREHSPGIGTLISVSPDGVVHLNRHRRGLHERNAACPSLNAGVSPGEAAPPQRAAG